MKKIKLLIILLLVLTLSLLVGCSGKNNSGGVLSGGGSLPSSKYTSDVEIGKAEISDDAKDDGEGTDESDYQDFEYPACQLTVASYNDNEHWDFYQSLITSGQETNGGFYGYQNKYNLYTNRIKLNIKNGNNVKVELLDDEGNVEFVAKGDANGLVYLYNNTKREDYNIKVTYKEVENVTKDMIVKDGDTIDLSLLESKNNILQLMFIVDTTGSMGDEISYLKSEIKDVIEKVKAQNEDITIYLALMFYRDEGDEYVVKYFDFTKDIGSQVNNLSEQRANGGGDFEEAVQDAFVKASEQQWLESLSTNIIIHVADAPSHSEDVNKWMDAVDKLAAKGVRIINIASSGINKETEYLFRNECIRTGGYYCYLTNDSGIGGDHIEATVEEEPIVEYLNDCLIRLINGIHTGDMKEAIYYKQRQES